MHILLSKQGPSKRNQGREEKVLCFMWGKRNSFLNKQLAGNVPVSTWVFVFLFCSSSSFLPLSGGIWNDALLQTRLKGTTPRRANGSASVEPYYVLVLWRTEGGVRSAGVGQTLTGVPALPEGSSQCTERKSSSNVRREMLSTKINLHGGNWGFKL